MTKPEQKPQSDLQRLIRLLEGALTALGVSPTARQVEEWSVLVHTSMSGGERDYHGIWHVFDVAEGMGAVQTLAALFHDTVYVQPDGYCSPHHAALLAEMIENRPDGFELRPYDPTADRQRALVEAVFGLRPGTVLSPWTGLNEFLSAMRAVRSLSAVLSDALLLEIAAGIEATIPFRPVDGGGNGPAERLLERLALANRDLSLGLDRAELERTVHRAVEVVNRDVAGFAFRDTGRFLDYTWKLLPEANFALRQKSSYTLGEYRLGLEKMAGFFAGLTPESVFFRFRGIPDDGSYSDLIARATTNIRRARRYLGAKLAAVAVLDALALLTGGDAPVALFMGDLPSPDQPAMRLEDYLPPAGPLCQDADPEVFALLHNGRQNHAGFDIKNSPLAAFIYARIGEAGMARLTAGNSHPMDAPLARRLLDALPGELRNEIICACREMALTRAAGLTRLIVGEG